MTNNKFEYRLFIISCVFFVHLLNSAETYKILVMAPGHSNSQLLFHYRFGDMIASHGHDVTIYVAHYNLKATAPAPKLAKVIFFKAIPNQEEFRQINERFQSRIFSSDFSWFLYMRSYIDYFQIYIKGCDTQLASKKLLNTLNETKFDVAIAHMYDYCPMAIIQALQIPAYIWMSSGVLIDSMAWKSGVPSPRSYVPNAYSAFSDRMTFVERMKNFIGSNFNRFLHWYGIVRKENAIFKRHFGADFPDIDQLAARASLLFINADEMLDFPRPVLHKVIYIGGVHMKNLEPLDAKWQKIADDSVDGFFVVSFGSVANASAMPAHWKETFLKTFSQFPTYTFIWKFDESEDKDILNQDVKNVVFTEWAPQRDLLGHRKVRGLITHCGYNSFIEAATFGVPIVAIPLFNDQIGNRRRAERLGFGIGIDRKSLNPTRLEWAIKEIIENDTYRLNAQKASKNLAKKPVKSEELTIGWIEYLAEFKNLSMLQPTSTDLNLFQYFMADVIFTLVAGLSIVLYITFCTIRRLVVLIIRKRKITQDIPIEENDKDK